MFCDHSLPESQNKPDEQRFVYANVLWDSASQENLISKDLARKLGYSGPPRSVIFEGVSGPTDPTSAAEVTVDVMDNNGKIHNIDALAAKCVCQVRSTPPLTTLQNRFSAS